MQELTISYSPVLRQLRTCYDDNIEQQWGPKQGYILLSLFCYPRLVVQSISSFLEARRSHIGNGVEEILHFKWKICDMTHEIHTQA